MPVATGSCEQTKFIKAHAQTVSKNHAGTFIMSSETVSLGRWVLDSAQQGLSSLRYEAISSPIDADALGPEDVLVDIRAASLNYRDLAIAKVKFRLRLDPN